MTKYYNITESNKEDLARIQTLFNVSGQALINYALKLTLKGIEKAFIDLEKNTGIANYDLLVESFRDIIKPKKQRSLKNVYSNK